MEAEDAKTKSDENKSSRPQVEECEIRECSCAGAAERFRINALEFATRRILKRGRAALLVALSLGISARAQNPPEDLSKLSVEDLMNVEVTAVSKKE
jgi:hypothetical protein